MQRICQPGPGSSCSPWREWPSPRCARWLTAFTLDAVQVQAQQVLIILLGLGADGAPITLALTSQELRECVLKAQLSPDRSLQSGGAGTPLDLCVQLRCRLPGLLHGHCGESAQSDALGLATLDAAVQRKGLCASRGDTQLQAGGLGVVDRQALASLWTGQRLQLFLREREPAFHVLTSLPGNGVTPGLRWGYVFGKKPEISM